ncbi:hypothetical protein KYB31_05485 [Clostridium felsineum]|uniref:hypothetical protein n=1 Tax=Clostridium felsineum TaxID=36839 RepID=UPI00214D8188|nr:hypothetical protein [Clostridium felsineum]MCR3758447.1 hypothetical protein [Clostridium felsineum]
MLKYYILKKFGDKLFAFFISKTGIKVKKYYKGYKRRKIRNQFVDSLDMQLLKKYGDKSFYNELSKLVVCDEVLDKIYDQCYSVESNNYKTNDEFLKELMSGEEYKCFDEKEIYEILKNILDSTFNILNQVQSDDMRKLINILTNAGNDKLAVPNSKLDNILGEIISLKKDIKNSKIVHDPIAQQKDVKLFSNPIFQCYKDNYKNCDINLSINSNKPLFKMKLRVKVNEDMKKFKSSNQYLNYLTFSGEDTILDVVEVKLQDVLSEKTYLSIKKECYEPTIDLQSFDISSIEEFTSEDDLKNMDLKIKIVPPKNRLLLNIQDENNENIFETKAYIIRRRKLENNDLEIIFDDVSENRDINVTIKNIFKIDSSIENSRIISSNMVITNNKINTVAGKLNYYKVFRKVVSARKLVYRDKNTGLYIGEGGGFVSSISIDKLDKLITIYNQVMYIQDYFKIIFNISDGLDFETIDRIKQIYELISCGITMLNNYDFNFKKSDFIISNEANENSIISIAAKIQYFSLFGKKIFIKNIKLIIPRSKICEVTNENYKLESISPACLISDEKIGELSEDNEIKSILNNLIRLGCDI